MSFFFKATIDRLISLSRLPNLDSAHPLQLDSVALRAHQTDCTITPKSYYPVPELTDMCAIFTLPSSNHTPDVVMVRLGSDNYQFSKSVVWLVRDLNT